MVIVMAFFKESFFVHLLYLNDNRILSSETTENGVMLENIKLLSSSIRTLLVSKNDIKQNCKTAA